jgi:hypothetical protein
LLLLVVAAAAVLAAEEVVPEDFAHLRAHQVVARLRKVNFQLQQAFLIP